MKFLVFYVLAAVAQSPDDLYNEGLSLLSKSSVKGISVLEKAGNYNAQSTGYEHNHDKALIALGDYFLFNSSTNRNSTIAFKHYSKLADLGNSIGQRMVGLQYATGIGVERDYAKAHLYMGLAVVGGDVLAAQVMGYWKRSGIATLKSCDESVFYYELVAKVVVDEFNSFHPLGKNTPRAKVNIPELEFGGVYGESVSGPGNPKVQKESSGSSLSTRDVLEYYSLQADGGDKTAQILLAQMYYMGSLKIPVDYAKARRYALLAYKQKPIDDDQKSEKKKDDKYTVSGSAADLLGKMYWRGEGVERNDVTARRWFEKGASVNNPDCIYSLGLMYEQGLAGLPKNGKKAFSYFLQAAELDNSNALVKVALRKNTDGETSFSKFSRSSGKGNLMGTYYLAQNYIKGIGVTVNCVTGTGLLRHLVQTADWHMPLTNLAETLYEAGDYSGSLILYIFAGELGYQVAQTNAAWLLDQGKISSADYPRVFTVNTTEKDRYKLAHPLWNRAANQGNVDARVKLGDYYYNECLGQDLNLSQRYEKAAEHYKLAADHEFSAIAMWNLAYMYETGSGVNRDYYLAKRMYDLCLTTNPAGYVPVNAALLKLYLKWIWSWLKGEKVQSLFAPPPSLSTPMKPPKEDDLYTMDNEEHGLFSGNLLLLFLIGVASLMFYYRQKVVAQSPQNRQSLPTDEELEPLIPHSDASAEDHDHS